MKYVLLIYRDEKAAAKASPADMQKEGAAYEAFTKSIVDSGNFLDGDPFEPTAQAQTVEVLHLEAGQYQLAGRWLPGKRARSRLLKGFEVSVADLIGKA